MNVADGDRLAAALKALGHPTRLNLLDTIISGDFCVSELEEQLDRRQANISQHLAILRDRGLVTPVRRGKSVCYRLTDPRIADLLTQARDIFGSTARRRRAASPAAVGAGRS